MKLISLQSGSNGNCVYVEAGGKRLLFDAGISGKQAQLRLAAHGRDIRAVDALIISHDHSDHVRCAGIFQRKFGLPIYATAETLRAAESWRSLGRLTDVRHFTAGSVLRFGDVRIETIPTPHDASDGCAFVLDDGRRRLGILTDLGHVFDGLRETLGTLDAVLLESNYDRDMLDNGPYPAFLKRRIRGPEGHISNVEAAELLRDAADGRMKWACLGHLSGENNTPELAYEAHQTILGGKVPLRIAGRHGATAVIDI